jgi:diguanylate cyclase (GGDEF)-like protein
MTNQIPEVENFASVLDALSAHICVIDKNSLIVAVNLAWRNFTIENPPISNRAGVGANYLKICRNASGPGSDDARKFSLGVEAVLQGKTASFQMEYPCHSPDQYRWFLGDVTSLKSRQRGAVISHTTITDRKVLELELMRLAATDPLTGLPNRRYFTEAANLEVERVNRFGGAASLVMIDLDNFKAVNDTYGHAVGDETLRCLARIFKEQLRQVDVFARIGGEEFVVMLPGTNEAGGVIVAEKLRLALSETAVKSGQNQFHATACFGVAEVRAGDKGTDECLGRADAALYAAKRNGRNRVERFAAVEAQKPNN